MIFGDLEFHILNDGTFRLDGGAMFGVVPKPMWQRVIPADRRNRITLAMHSLLIRAGGKLILVETGAGDKWNAKMRDIYAFEGRRLPEQLADRGVKPEQIDFVVNTHLHLDHCGWNTQVTDGKLVPTFPNARYVVARGELEHALHPTEREQGSYFPDNYEPIQKSGQWQLIEQDLEIAPGVELIRAPGHVMDMIIVRLWGGGQTAVFLADLIPTHAHLPYPWIMGLDIFPLTTLETKKKWLPEIAHNGWLALFGHDKDMTAARLRENGPGNFIAEPVTTD